MNKITFISASLLALITLAACGDVSSSASSSLESSESSSESLSSEVSLSSSSEEVSLPLTDQELVEAAVNIGAIALYQSKGTVVNPTRLNTHTLADGSLTVATSIPVDGNTVSLAWSANPAEAVTIGETDGTGRKTISFVFPDPGASDLAVTLTVTATYNEASASLDYEFSLVAPEDNVVITPLSEIRSAYAGGTLAVGTVLTVEGFFTGAQDDYDIFFIQQGDYAIGIYKAAAYKANNYQPGDFLRVRGKFSPYNGLMEIGFIEEVLKLNTPPQGAEEPVTFTITTWSSAALANRDGAKVSMSGLTYVSGADTWDPSANSHLSLNFSFNGTPVTLRVNYHIGATNRTAIRDFILANASATFNYDGLLGWFNGPQLAILTVADLSVAA